MLHDLPALRAWERFVGPVLAPPVPETPVPAAPRPEPSRYDDPEALDRVVVRYLATVKLIQGMASALGLAAVSVVQPVPTYKYDLRYHWYQGSFGGVERMRFGYPRLAERVRAEPPGPHLVWCADIQEASRELLYVDRVHYTPVLSERLAACIVDAIRERRLLE